MHFKIPMRDGKMGDYADACSRFRGTRKTVWMEVSGGLEGLSHMVEHTKDSNPEFWAVQLKIPSET